MKNSKSFFFNASLYILLAIVLILGLMFSIKVIKHVGKNPSNTQIDSIDIYYQYSILDGDTILIDVYSEDCLTNDLYYDDLLWEDIPRDSYMINNIKMIPHFVEYKY